MIRNLLLAILLCISVECRAQETILSSHLPANDQNAIEAVARFFPSDDFLEALGHFFFFANQFELAQGCYLRVLQSRSQGGPSAEVAVTMRHLGDVLALHGSLNWAKTLYRRAIATLDKACGPNHPERPRAFHALARLLIAQEEYPEGEALSHQALLLHERFCGPESLAVAVIRQNLIQAALGQMKLGTAAKHLQMLQKILQREFGDDSPVLAVALYQQATLELLRGNVVAAHIISARSVAAAARLYGENHFVYAALLTLHAGIQGYSGDWKGAEETCQRSLTRREKIFGQESFPVGENYFISALLANAQASTSAAIEHLNQALALKEKFLGVDHPASAREKVHLADFLAKSGHIAKAETLARHTLALQETFFGADSLNLVANLHVLAEISMAKKRFAEAEAILTRSIAIAEPVWENENPCFPTTFHLLGQARYEQGDLPGAEKAARQALDRILRQDPLPLDRVVEVNELLGEIALAKRDFSGAETYLLKVLESRQKTMERFPQKFINVQWSLAEAYKGQKLFKEARNCFFQMFQTIEKLWGKKSVESLEMLLSYASFLDECADFREEEAPLHTALALSNELRGEDHPDSIDILNRLGSLYWLLGRFAESEMVLKQALGFLEKRGEKESTLFGNVSGNLALTFASTGRFTQARQLGEQALAVFRHNLPQSEFALSTTLNNLSEILQEEGRFQEAKKNLETALAIREKISGKHSLPVAIVLNNLGKLHFMLAQTEDALHCFRKAETIMAKEVGPEHPFLAFVLANIAGIALEQKNFREAENLLNRSLIISGKTFGPDHPQVALDINNLGGLYYTLREFSKAKQAFFRARDSLEKSVGCDHPLFATLLMNLSAVFLEENDLPAAESLVQQALEIREKTFGKNHPAVAEAIFVQGELLSRGGNHQASHARYRSGMEIWQTLRDKVFLALSGRQRMMYVQSVQGRLFQFLSHAVHFMADDPQAIREAFTVWLQWKGAVVENQRGVMASLEETADPATRKDFDEWLTLQRRIGSLLFCNGQALPFAERQEVLAILGQKTEALEVSLAQSGQADFQRKEATRIQIASLSVLLPSDSLFLDFARIRDFDFATGSWGSDSLLLFALEPGPVPVVTMKILPGAEEVMQVLAKFKGEIRRVLESGKLPYTQVLQKHGDRLHQLLLNPVSPQLVGKKHLIISPDSFLHLLPFEALVQANGKYLIEDFLVSYISAGRDLMPLQRPRAVSDFAFILANPNFDAALPPAGTGAASPPGTEDPEVFSANDVSLSFSPLPETKQEADFIADLLQTHFGIKVFNAQQDQAREGAVASLKNPRFVHISTHGFFLRDFEWLECFGREVFFTAPLGKPHFQLDPLQRCGFSCSGVNTSLKMGGNEGLMTAEKITGLDFRGTELVVLAACQSGVGEFSDGQGLTGMARAFFTAGAQNLIVSLWSVANQETVSLMKDFYSFLAAGKSKAEALREAKLKLMAKTRNPFFWAPFVISGKPN